MLQLYNSQTFKYHILNRKILTYPSCYTKICFRFVMKLNLYTTFNEQFIKWNGNMSFQASLICRPNLLCRPKHLMNCISQIKITCASVYLLLSIFLAFVCLAFWTPIARVMKETTQRVTWNRVKSIKFPPTPPIWCQIPHPNNNHWCQIPAPLGTSTSQMPGVCPGGGCWCLYLIDT